MRVKRKIAAIVCFLLSYEVFSEEEGTATLVKQVTPKPGTDVTSLILNNEDIVASFGDGSVLEFNKELESKREIAKAGSYVTSIAFSRDKQHLAIGTTSHGTMRYERDFLSSTYKQSDVQFRQNNPISLAFSPKGAYLLTTDSAGRGLVFLNEDKKNVNSGKGNLVCPIFKDDTKVYGAIPFGDDMVYLLADRISKFSYVWNDSFYETENELTAKAEKGPEQGTETVLVNERAVCAAFDQLLRNTLYYTTKTDSTKLYKISIVESEKKPTLIYMFSGKVNSVAGDGMNIYVTTDDRINILREEYGTLTIKNDTDVSVSLFINGNFEKSITAEAEIEVIKKPGTILPTITASNANVYFNSYDNNTAFDLKNKDRVFLQISRRYPLRLIPNQSRILPINGAAVDEESTLYAFCVNYNEGQALIVLDAKTHKIQYKLIFVDNILFLFHGGYLLVAEGNNVYAYDRSGKLEKSWRSEEEIKTLSGYKNKIIAVTQNTVEYIDISSEDIRQVTFPNYKGEENQGIACLLDENTFVVAKNNATEVFKVNNEIANLSHRIPRSWTGEPRQIIPLDNGSFAIFTADNRLGIYNGDPEQIESKFFQLGKELKYQYTYKKGGATFLRFINRNNNLEDHDIEFPEKNNVLYIETKELYGDSDTIFIAEGGGVHLYENYNVKGVYYCFENLETLFVAPGTANTNDCFFPGSDSFDPFINLEVNENTEKRNFQPADYEKTIGG